MLDLSAAYPNTSRLHYDECTLQSIALCCYQVSHINRCIQTSSPRVTQVDNAGARLTADIDDPAEVTVFGYEDPLFVRRPLKYVLIGYARPILGYGLDVVTCN